MKCVVWDLNPGLKLGGLEFYHRTNNAHNNFWCVGVGPQNTLFCATFSGVSKNHLKWKLLWLHNTDNTFTTSSWPNTRTKAPIVSWILRRAQSNRLGLTRTRIKRPISKRINNLLWDSERKIRTFDARRRRVMSPMGITRLPCLTSFKLATGRGFQALFNLWIFACDFIDFRKLSPKSFYDCCQRAERGIRTHDLQIHILMP